jgi:hypothetical protein
LRAPRTLLGDRVSSFLGFAGSKNLSWRPYLLYYGVCGLQEPFLATVFPLFWGLRAPRNILGYTTSLFPALRAPRNFLMTVFVISEFLFY